MKYIWYFTFLSCFTTVLADYYIDNANASVVYSMPSKPAASGWQEYSNITQKQTLEITNSTGNYTMFVDPAHCYNQNYARAGCSTADNCFFEIPFTGSGITIYVLSAGFSGVLASFSIDGGAVAYSSMDAPPPPAYQVSNVSLYSIQGLLSEHHTMKITLLSWKSTITYLKFDYAYVNETFVAPPATTSSTSTMTSTGSPRPSSSNSNNIGGIVGATLGGLALISGILIGGYFCRQGRKAARRGISPTVPNMEASPFTSEVGSPTPPPPVLFAPHNPFDSQYHEIASRTRSAIFRDAHAAGSCSYSGSDLSIRPAQSSGALQPLCRPPSPVDDIADTHPASSSASYIADSTSWSSPFSDPELASRYNLTEEQGELIRQLQRDNVPMETIARVIEGYVSSNFASGGRVAPRRAMSLVSTAPPPSYHTREK